MICGVHSHGYKTTTTTYKYCVGYEELPCWKEQAISQFNCYDGMSIIRTVNIFSQVTPKHFQISTLVPWHVEA